jgi:hypothetical protein
MSDGAAHATITLANSESVVAGTHALSAQRGAAVPGFPLPDRPARNAR